MTLACVLKGEDDRKTNDRGMALHRTCTQINRTILNNSDVKVKAGAYSAWLEISYDPTKSKWPALSPNFAEGPNAPGQNQVPQGPGSPRGNPNVV